MNLRCWLFGHKPFVWDRLDDQTRIFGCPRCGTYRRRDVSDPRPIEKNTDPRFQLVRPRVVRGRFS